MFQVKVDFGYQGKAPLLYKNVDIRFEHGDIVNIVGENGCGKSTFYKMLMGELKPLAGIVEQEIRDNVAIVSDYVGLPDECLVRDILAFMDPGKAAYMEAAFPVLHQGVKRLAGQKVSVLSSGQRRLLEIYCALSTRRSILILDEASNGLDLYNRQLVIEQVKKLAGSNKIAVFNTTHYLEDVADLGGIAYIMDKRRNSITRYTDELSVDGIRRYMKEMIKNEGTISF